MAPEGGHEMNLENIKQIAHLTSKDRKQRKPKVKIAPIGPTWRTYISQNYGEQFSATIDLTYSSDSDATIDFDFDRYRKRRQEIQGKYGKRVQLKLKVNHWPHLHGDSHRQHT